MPLGFDESEAITWSHQTDRDKQKPPAYKLRFPSCRRYGVMSALHAKASLTETNQEETEASLDSLIKEAVIGWDGFINVLVPKTDSQYRKPWPFSPQNLDLLLSDVLTVREKWELANACMFEPNLKEKEKNSSASQIESGVATSAGKDAPASQDSATSAPPQANQQV